MSGYPTRAQGRAKEISIDDLRSEIARRAVWISPNDPRESPMLIAAIAVLTASGRIDFREDEIRREISRLQAELAARYGFADDEIAAGAAKWQEILDAALELPTIADSTYRMWFEPIEAVALARGRLWLSAPAGVSAWIETRYAPLFEKLGAVDVRMMGSTKSENERRERIK